MSGLRDDSEFETVHVDAAFALASVVAERTFRNPRLSETPIKRRGVVAAPEGEGSLRDRRERRMRRHIAITIDEKVYEAEVEPRVLLSDFIRPEARLTLTLEPLLAPMRDHAGIREMQACNACRCTGYQNIVRAVPLALERRAGTKAIPA